MPTQFENPYLADINQGRNAVRRLTTDVSVADYNLIKSIRVSNGTITITINTLWKKLCDELRARNITDFTSVDEFEDFVSNLKLIPQADYEQLCANGIRLPDGTAGRPACDESSSLQRRATPRARGKSTKETH